MIFGDSQENSYQRLTGDGCMGLFSLCMVSGFILIVLGIYLYDSPQSMDVSRLLICPHSFKRTVVYITPENSYRIYYLINMMMTGLGGTILCIILNPPLMFRFISRSTPFMFGWSKGLIKLYLHFVLLWIIVICGLVLPFAGAGITYSCAPL